MFSNISEINVTAADKYNEQMGWGKHSKYQGEVGLPSQRGTDEMAHSDLRGELGFLCDTYIISSHISQSSSFITVITTLANQISGWLSHSWPFLLPLSWKFSEGRYPSLTCLEHSILSV